MKNHRSHAVLTMLMVGLLGLLAPVSTVPLASAPRDIVQSAALVVTSAADSGPGTFRQALLDAQAGDSITFDPTVFPPGTPVTITLSSGLPRIEQGNLRIDGTGSRVVLDGASIGTTPETLLLDDVSLTLDGGTNLIANGDFTAGKGHWRPWDETPGATRSISTSDHASAPRSYAWSTTARIRGSRTLYDTSNTDTPITGWPYSAGSTAWIAAAGGSTAELRFWYKGGQPTVRLRALLANGDIQVVEEEWFEWQADWTNVSISSSLPGNAQGIALELQYNHREAFTNGIVVRSDGNVIRRLRITSFPDTGITLATAQDNLIEYNETANNGSRGMGLWGASQNVLQHNIVGTDQSGATPLGNHGSGIFVTDNSSGNRIGPSNIVAHNRVDGVEIFGRAALGNKITQNSIHHNEAMGIELWDGGNQELRAPAIFDFDLAAGTIAGTACPNCSIEVFSDDEDEGAVYEGRTVADGLGAYTLNKGTPFSGPRLTATATDQSGNTSSFSTPTTGVRQTAALQAGNSLPRFRTQPKTSPELADNRMGEFFGLNFENTTPQAHVDNLSSYGYKNMTVSLDAFDWTDVAKGVAGYSQKLIRPEQDQAIALMGANGIKIMLCLVFWDEQLGIPEPGHPRFGTQQEIDRYLDYVRFVVSNLQDRIEYWLIFNEPYYSDAVSSQQNIRASDYVELTRQATAAIRAASPQAKIAVGATTVGDEAWREYLFEILRSDIMPSVDAVVFHPGPTYTPAYTETETMYYEYPTIVQEIMDVSTAHGFDGEFIVESLGFLHHDDQTCDPCFPWTHGYIDGAKYLARGIVLHLGMDVAAGMADKVESVHKKQVVRNLATIMAGAEPVHLSVDVQTTVTDVVSYTFALPNGEHLVAVWRDNVAVNDDTGTPATLKLSGFASHTIVGIDVLKSLEQKLIARVEGDDLVIEDLLVMDYPIVLRAVPTRRSFLPLVLNRY